MAVEDPWRAFSVDDVATLLDDLPVRWWVAGGQAIDLFVGSSTRRHQDVDVALLRPDQLTVQAYLDGWTCASATRVASLTGLQGGSSPPTSTVFGLGRAQPRLGGRSCC
jgi:hypothetical protein